MLMKAVLTREPVAAKTDCTSEELPPRGPLGIGPAGGLVMDAAASPRLATSAPAIPRFATTVIVEIIFMLLTLNSIICVLKKRKARDCKRIPGPDGSIFKMERSDERH